MKPLVAIVGRPNVGKSTLFNRLVGRRLAIVEDVPGVTRDRHYADAEWRGRAFTVIDTGGFVPGEEDGLLAQVRDQAQLAVEEADVTLLLVDGQEGLTATDQEVARALRKSGKPIILGVNKLDSPGKAEAGTADFFRLGIRHVLPLSAEHALGAEALKDTLLELLPLPPPEEGGVEGGLESEPPAVRLAIVGRPNVGKSTLVNALLEKQRVVASELPGTTRDPIDTELSFEGKRFILTDTAGIRRKKAIAQRLEKFSVVAALRVVERSDIAVLLLDATEPAVEQDARIAGLAEAEGRGLILVVNKWDKVPKAKRDEGAFREELKLQLKFVAYAPIVFTSALTGAKVRKVLELGGRLYEQFHFRAPTPRLNRLLEHMVDSNPAPIVGGKPLRLYYIAQVSTAPPTFALTCNRPLKVPDSYKRYITNQIREAFQLRVPIILLFRERPGQAKRIARKRLKARD
jgi:GTP-binding protein